MNLARLVPAIHKGVLSLALLSGAACAPSYPPIAGSVRGDAAFKARIATAYPPGSAASRLRAMLAAEGFRLIEDPVARRFSGLEAPPNLPCFSTTRIDWTEDRRGRILEIQAARHSCS